MLSQNYILFFLEGYPLFNQWPPYFSGTLGLWEKKQLFLLLSIALSDQTCSKTTLIMSYRTSEKKINEISTCNAQTNRPIFSCHLLVLIVVTRWWQMQFMHPGNLNKELLETATSNWRITLAPSVSFLIYIYIFFLKKKQKFWDAGWQDGWLKKSFSLAKGWVKEPGRELWVEMRWLQRRARKTKPILSRPAFVSFWCLTR